MGFAYTKPESFNEYLINIIIIVATLRKPNLFSIHDGYSWSNCLAIDPEWTGRNDCSHLDEINSVIVCEKYTGKKSQLFKFIRVNNQELTFLRNFFVNEV